MDLLTFGETLVVSTMSFSVREEIDVSSTIMDFGNVVDVKRPTFENYMIWFVDADYQCLVTNVTDAESCDFYILRNV